MEIDNNDTTIDINYTHFDADLDSIIENTLTINAPANAAVNVKYGAVDKVLTEKIEKLIGKEKCEVKFDKNNNKASISLALDTTEEQIASVQQLLGRVLPQNIVTEIEWADGLPMSYTRLEYLESSGTQFIPTSHQVHYNDSMEIRCSFLPPRNNAQNVFVPIDARITDDGYYIMQFNVQTTQTLDANLSWGTRTNPVFTTIKPLPYEKNRTYLCRMQKGKFYFDEVPYDIKVTSEPLENPQFKVFASVSASYYSAGRVTRANLYRNNEIIANLIPALDLTGTPCMFDTVTRTPFYNSGTGDFTYPGAEQAVQTTDLETKSYAKLTEHGIRRLYHVPKGYTGTIDDYAAANGFKELVEPPMPFESYWTLVWRETETQLICDWVETEPPVEEVETLNNKN